MAAANNIEQQSKRKIIAFWRPSDPYAFCGQWFESGFKLDDLILATLPNQITNLELFTEKKHVIEKLSVAGYFPTAEKFMMMGKAALFNDDVIFAKMGKIDDPKVHRSLGRLVVNFDNEIWDKFSTDIVSLGNYLKFSQNPDIKKQLKNTKNAIIVEGSPMDRIWGVGLKFDNPDVLDKCKWRGKNLLGECLMFIRDLV
jgi:ribA/ribD-fused uncharacterized protein